MSRYTGEPERNHSRISASHHLNHAWNIMHRKRFEDFRSYVRGVAWHRRIERVLRRIGEA